MGEKAEVPRGVAMKRSNNATCLNDIPDPTSVSDEVVALMKVAAADLETKGYAVVPGIIDERTRGILRQCLEETLVGIGGARYRDKLPINKGIILEPSAIVHSDVAWKARKLVAPYFCALFGSGSLWSSFDRINICAAGARRVEWLHTDQSSLFDGRFRIQGYLDVNGTTEHDSGLVVCEGSHLEHAKLLNEWGIKRKKHWYLMREAEAAACRKQFRTHKVLCAPGSLVLWDSRTFHENEAAASCGTDRCVFYTCMLPRSHAEAAGQRRYADLKARKQDNTL